jgi:hypothetical protein
MFSPDRNVDKAGQPKRRQERMMLNLSTKPSLHSAHLIYNIAVAAAAAADDH